MLNRDRIQGILLSSARPELTIYRNEKKNLGYEVRARVFFRADNSDFLWSLQEGLAEQLIIATFRENESKVRPKPVLWVSGISNLYALCRLVPRDEPDAKNIWPSFKAAIEIIYEGEHNTQDGLDRLLELKGLL